MSQGPPHLAPGAFDTTVSVVKPVELGAPTPSRYSAVRKWFSAAEAVGEFVGIRYAHLAPGKTEPTWWYYSHKDFDGIGAFAEILRSRGVELRVLPQIKYYAAYSAIVSALKHWPRYLAPHRPLAWRSLERDERALRSPQPPVAVAWHIFDEPTSLAIRLRARNLGITVNTFLLHAIGRAVGFLLQDQAVPVPWMIPVNMRGGVQQDRDTDNHTSYVAVRLHPEEPASNVHRRILKALSRGEHWGNWHAFKLGHWMPHRLREQFARSGRALSQWSVGAFSNLGEWDPDKRISSPDALGNWFFNPPALRTQMIAVGCLTFQGRLSLSCQAHPALTTSVPEIRALIGRWVADIEARLVGPEDEGSTSGTAVIGE